MNWSDLGAGLALYLVLEGLLPFLNPGAARRAFVALSRMDERALRGIGLAAMIAGCLVLYFVRGST